jgi:hypothetical protein
VSDIVLVLFYSFSHQKQKKKIACGNTISILPFQFVCETLWSDYEIDCSAILEDAHWIIIDILLLIFLIYFKNRDRHDEKNKTYNLQKNNNNISTWYVFFL